MIEIDSSIQIYGQHFSPAKAMEICGLNLTNTVEPGQIMNRGRYKDSPAPYGSGSLRNGDDLVSLLQNFEKFKSEIIACGATDLLLKLGVEYQGQCNLEFSTVELQAIAASQIPMAISCWSKVEDPS